MRKFTKSEDDYILANTHHSCVQMAKELTLLFGIKRSHQSVSHRCRILGVSLINENRHEYTNDECDFLITNISSNSYTELRKKFNKKFGLKKQHGP